MAQPLLIEYLEKHNISYVKREIKAYDKAGSRISVPKDWGGRVIVVKDTYDPSDNLKIVMEQLCEELRRCEHMRSIASTVLDLSCAKIDDEILAKTGRDNEICRKCPFGRKIPGLIKKVEHFYEENEDITRRLSEDFFENRE